MEKKALIFILLFCAVCFSMHSQSLKFGLRGGLNLSKVNMSKDDFTEDNYTGFQIGPTLEVGLIDKFALSTSLLYSQKGIKIDGLNTKVDAKTGYLDIPIDFRYKIGILPLLKPYVSAGPYASFKVSDNLSDQWKAKSFAAGVNLGFGVYLLSRIQVGANYGIGLTDDYKNDKPDVSDLSSSLSAKNNTWSIFTTIYF